MTGPVPLQPAEGKLCFQRITTPPSFLHCPAPQHSLSYGIRYRRALRNGGYCGTAAVFELFSNDECWHGDSTACTTQMFTCSTNYSDVPRSIT